MSDVYEEAFHHLVWATKRREEMIVPRMESLLYTYIRQKCREMKAFVHAVGGMPDHVHLVCSVPVSISVSSFVNGVKGGSSFYISHHANGDPLRWQPGYGLLTFAKHDLPRIVRYVEHQKKHHASGRLSLKMEQTSSGPEGLSPGSPALQGRGDGIAAQLV